MLEHVIAAKEPVSVHPDTPALPVNVCPVPTTVQGRDPVSPSPRYEERLKLNQQQRRRCEVGESSETGVTGKMSIVVAGGVP